MSIKWVGLAKDKSLLEPIKEFAKQKHQPFRQVSTVKELEHALNTDTGSVVFLAPSTDYDLYDLCGELTYSFAYTSVILATENDQMDLKKAMYVGAVDMISLPINKNELDQAATKAVNIIEVKKEKNKSTDEEERKNRVVTVCSTKGGVGKTTISVNLASAVAKQNLKVAVIDLDLQFGDVAIMFDAHPQKTIYEWVKESYEEGNGELSGYLTHHSSGVDILAAPSLPEFAELITGEHVQFIINQLKDSYDFIVVDTPPAFVETVLVALENSDEILLITSMDLPTLKNGKLAVDTLQLLGLKDRIKVVLNRDTEMKGMKADTVEKIMGMEVYSRIPSDFLTVVESLNKGIPFVISETRSAVSKSIIDLSTNLYYKKKPDKTERNEPKPKRSIMKLFTRKGGK